MCTLRGDLTLEEMKKRKLYDSKMAIRLNSRSVTLQVSVCVCVCVCVLSGVNISDQLQDKREWIC